MMCLVLVWLIGFVALPYCATSIAYVAVNPPGVASFEHRLDVVGHLPLNTFMVDRRVVAAKKLGISPDEIPANVDEFSFLPDYELSAHPLGKFIRAMNEAGNESDVRRSASMIAAGADQTRWEHRVESLAQWIRRLSPYGCFLNASVSLANTGFTREQQLRDMAQRYLLDCAVYVQKLGYSITGIKGRPLPAPSLKEYSVQSRLRESLIDISLIALFAVLAFLITYRNFMRREI